MRTARCQHKEVRRDGGGFPGVAHVHFPYLHPHQGCCRQQQDAPLPPPPPPSPLLTTTQTQGRLPLFSWCRRRYWTRYQRRHRRPCQGRYRRPTRAPQLHFPASRRRSRQWLKTRGLPRYYPCLLYTSDAADE